MIKYIRQLPVGFFGSVIGLSALAIAWRIAHNLLDVPVWIADWIGFFAIADFIIISLLYIIKIFFCWEDVKIEFNHPVTESLFSAIPVALMFIAAILLIYAPVVANNIWHAGAISMALFMIFIIHRWIRNKRNDQYSNLTWLLPVTGLISIPFIGLSFPVRAMWLFSQLSFAGGLILAIALFVMVISGLFFGKKENVNEPGAIFILIAPFIMSFLSYTRIKETIDSFADILYYAGLSLFIIFLPKIFSSWKSSPYGVSWWGTSFPFSLLTIAAFKYVEAQNLEFRVPANIAMVLLGMSSMAAVVIFFLCVVGLFRKKF
jgi:tellurite resistance protein